MFDAVFSSSEARVNKDVKKVFGLEPPGYETVGTLTVLAATRTSAVSKPSAYPSISFITKALLLFGYSG